MTESLKVEVENKILPVLSDGIEKYYEVNPIAFVLVPPKAREYIENKLKQQNIKIAYRNPLQKIIKRQYIKMAYRNPLRRLIKKWRY